MFDKEEYPFALKVILIGEPDVGKVDIISKYIKNSFPSSLLNTPCRDYVSFISFIKFFEGENLSIQFDIWDIAYLERFRQGRDHCPLDRVFYGDASVVILVYDITRKSSFNELKNHWVKEIKENARKDISKKNL